MPTTLELAEPTKTLLAASEFIPQRRSSIRNNQSLSILDVKYNKSLRKNKAEAINTTPP